MRIRSLLPLLATVVLAQLPSTPARADPLFGWGENAVEDQFADGDIDEEDHIAMHLGGYTAAADVHGQSWLSLVGFTRALRSGKNDIGGFVVVGLALDRIAAGPTHRLADPPRALPLPPPPPPSVAPPPPAPQIELAAAPGLARECVAAALRTSGLGTNDARIDSLISRARASAWLPETRVRGMRLWTDAAHTTTVAATDTSNYYDALGANLVLELRMTWRFDRLFYAGDEATLERVRLERQDARTRVATRTLEVLFAWQRATIDGRSAIAGSREDLEARLRVAEAEASLDVLTGGWFSERDAPRPAPPPPERTGSSDPP